MIFDTQNTTLSNGMISSPDFAFADVAKQPADVVETIILRGNVVETDLSVQGTVDNQ